MGAVRSWTRIPVGLEVGAQVLRAVRRLETEPVPAGMVLAALEAAFDPGEAVVVRGREPPQEPSSRAAAARSERSQVSHSGVPRGRRDAPRWLTYRPNAGRIRAQSRGDAVDSRAWVRAPSRTRSPRCCGRSNSRPATGSRTSSGCRTCRARSRRPPSGRRRSRSRATPARRWRGSRGSSSTAPEGPR